MRQLPSILVLLTLTAATSAVAQETAAQVVSDNVPLFEQMFTVIGLTSGAARDSYLGHIGFSPAQRETVVKIAGLFRVQEDILRGQAQTALSEGRPDRDVTLADIRARRQRLFLQYANQVVQELGPEGVNAIQKYVQRLTASIPRRTNP
jgi:hypothetical protein